MSPLAGVARRDLLIGLAAFTAYVVEAAVSRDAKGPFLSDAAFYGVAGLLMIWRRRAPALVLAGTMIAAGCATALGTGVTHMATALLLLVIPPYAVGHDAEDREAWAGIVAGLVLMVVATALSDSISLNNTGFPAGIMLASFTVGRLLRTRMLMTRALADEAARLELDRDARAQAAVGEERARIAREMHDVVAHTMAIMVVQAGGARRVLDKDPAAAERALATVEETGRVALGELRRLLGFLREDGPAELEPQPTLDGLDALVAKANEVGLPTELRIEGAAGTLPAGAELAVYRLVQEALTNTYKHAGRGARATVALRWTAGALELSVTDTGGRGADAGGGAGHGLIGMRERVAMLGGELTAEPQAAGGFAVRATIPRSAEVPVS